MTTVTTNFTAVAEGAALSIAARDEVISFDLSGTYAATIVFERAMGSGIDAWEPISQQYSVANATVAFEYTTRMRNEKLRARCIAFTSGTAATTVADGDKVLFVRRDDEKNVIYTDYQEQGRVFSKKVDAAAGLSAAGDIIFRPADGLPVLLKAAAPSVSTTSTDATEAEVLGGLHVKTPTAAQNWQLPTGTEMDTAIAAAFAGDASLAIGDTFDFHMINLGGTGDIVTITTDTGFTVVGYMGIHPAADGATLGYSAGHFRARRTAANTWVLYRIG